MFDKITLKRAYRDFTLLGYCPNSFSREEFFKASFKTFYNTQDTYHTKLINKIKSYEDNLENIKKLINNNKDYWISLESEDESYPLLDSKDYFQYFINLNMGDFDIFNFDNSKYNIIIFDHNGSKVSEDSNYIVIKETKNKYNIFNKEKELLFFVTIDSFGDVAVNDGKYRLYEGEVISEETYNKYKNLFDTEDFDNYRTEYNKEVIGSIGAQFSKEYVSSVLCINENVDKSNLDMDLLETIGLASFYLALDLYIKYNETSWNFKRNSDSN